MVRMKCELRTVEEEDDSFLFEVYASTRQKEIESWGCLIK